MFGDIQKSKRKVFFVFLATPQSWLILAAGGSTLRRITYHIWLGKDAGLMSPDVTVNFNSIDCAATIRINKVHPCTCKNNKIELVLK